MTTVKKILNDKGANVRTINLDETVLNAIQIMSGNNIGSLVVVDDKKPVGIFTERDYMNNVILKGRSSPRTPVRDAMSTNVVYVKPTQDVNECMAIMTEMNIRHLPVFDDDKLVGIISIGDLLKNVISDQQHEIDSLEHYIYEDRRYPFQDGEG